MATATKRERATVDAVGWADQIAREYADTIRTEHDPPAAVLAAIRHAVHHGAREMLATLRLHGRLA